jgi:hypothetical protein
MSSPSTQKHENRLQLHVWNSFLGTAQMSPDWHWPLRELDVLGLTIFMCRHQTHKIEKQIEVTFRTPLVGPDLKKREVA